MKCERCGGEFAAQGGAAGGDEICPNPECGARVAVTKEAGKPAIGWVIASSKSLFRLVGGWWGHVKTLPVARQAMSKMGSMDFRGFLKAVNETGIMGPEDLRGAVQKVVKGVVGVGGLVLVQIAVCPFISFGGDFLGLTIGQWLDVLLAAVVVGFAAGIFAPVRSIVRFRADRWAKERGMGDGEKERTGLVAAAGDATLLVFVVLGYCYILPRISRCQHAFMDFLPLVTMANLAALCLVGWIVARLWSNGQWLFDIWSGRLADKVSNLWGADVEKPGQESPAGHGGREVSSGPTASGAGASPRVDALPEAYKSGSGGDSDCSGRVE